MPDINCIYNDSLYGNYRTKKFTDYFPNVEAFKTEFEDSPIKADFQSDTTVDTLYYLLYARYGNSTIASSDPNQFKFKLWTIIFSYGPSWEKRLDIQKELRGLTENDLIAGSTQIYNHSYNPSTAPSTSTLDELTTINEQNTQKQKRSKLDAYSFLWDLLDTDVTTEFLNRFQGLFLKIVEPELPLWYVTNISQED